MLFGGFSISIEIQSKNKLILDIKQKEWETSNVNLELFFSTLSKVKFAKYKCNPTYASFVDEDDNNDKNNDVNVYNIFIKNIVFIIRLQINGVNGVITWLKKSTDVDK